MNYSQSTADQLGSLPTGWCAFTDAATLRTYYAHIPTGDVRWERPPNPPPPPPLPPSEAHPQFPLQVHPTTMQANVQTFPTAVRSPIPPPPPPRRAFTTPIQNGANFIPLSASFRCAPPSNSTYQTPHQLSCYTQPSPSTSNNRPQQQQQQQSQCPQHLPGATTLSRNACFEPQGRKRTPDQSHQLNPIHYQGNTQKEGNTMTGDTKRARYGVSANQCTVPIINQNKKMKKCSKCNQECGRKDFSKRQWMLSGSVRKCKKCPDAVGKKAQGKSKEKVSLRKNSGDASSATASTLSEVKQTQVGLAKKLPEPESLNQSQSNRRSVEQPVSATLPRKSSPVASLGLKDTVELPSSSNHTIGDKKIKQEDENHMDSGSNIPCLDLSTNQDASKSNKQNGKFPNQGKTKQCSTCKKECERSNFSKQQWGLPPCLRKCNSCMEDGKTKDSNGSEDGLKSSETKDCTSFAAATGYHLRSRGNSSSSAFKGGVETVTSAIIKTEDTPSSSSILESTNMDLLASAAATRTTAPITVTSSSAATVSTKSSTTNKKCKVNEKRCTMCKKLCGSKAFSKRQWRAKTKGRKCRVCAKEEV